MKKNLHAFLAVLSLIFSGSLAHAYELATHGRMTYEAFKLSVLNSNPNDPNDPQLLKKILGIENGANPFGNAYYDISGSSIQERTSQSFEEDQTASRMPPNTEPLSIEGWLMRGAIREDDFYGGNNPQDDPTLRRPLHHFYDPVYDRPLTMPGIGLLDSDIHTAPAWSIGSREPFTQPNTPETGRRNHFTVLDAREAMYWALTGKKKDGTDGGPNNQPATETDRKAYWATLFRALGDIVHLVQDTAQPQHTRNDQHAGKFPEFLTGHKSVYEAYLDCRATGGSIEGIDNYQDYYIDTCGSLTYDGYATPVFAKYSDFFSTRDASGKGLADFSNRGFFTAGTNLGSNNYPSPTNNRSQYTEERIDNLVFLRGDVTDTQTGETNNIRFTTESAFDFFLGTYRRYSLNSYNYDDMADLLIPRAVAYSAGLIDYVFSGRIEAEDARYSEADARRTT